MMARRNICRGNIPRRYEHTIPSLANSAKKKRSIVQTTSIVDGHLGRQFQHPLVKGHYFLFLIS
jgi:hypothetical protein